MFQFVSTHLSIVPPPVPALSQIGGRFVVGLLAVVGVVMGCRRIRS